MGSGYFVLWCYTTQSRVDWNFELKFQSKLDLYSGNHATYRVQKRKIHFGCQAAILKTMSLKINRLLHIYTNIVLLKFGVDIQSQTKSGNQKIPIESDIAEHQYASAYGHNQHGHEIRNWDFKANLTYTLETMSSTDRRTDPPPPPPSPLCFPTKYFLLVY